MQITNLLGSLYVKPLPFNAPTGRSLVDNVTTKVAADASSFADSLTTAAAASTATTSIATTPTPPDASASSSDKSKNDQATQDFLDYMKETPAQRLEDAWLASHHLTRKQLEAEGNREADGNRDRSADQASGAIAAEDRHRRLSLGRDGRATPPLCRQS
jgi:hypothetical protein